MSNITVYQRNTCRVCGSKDLYRWVHLPHMPLTDDLRKSVNDPDVFYEDIDIYVCLECGVSQTQKAYDFNEYYLDYAYTVAASSFANNFMEKLANKVVRQFNLPNECAVLEVGSGDGQQLSYFKKIGAKVMGFEPSDELCRRSEAIGIPVYQGLFTEESIHDIPTDYRNADVLLLTYTFDHIPEPMLFLNAAKQIINSKSGLLVIEVHDLEKIVNRREYCLFEHEHFVYLTENTMRDVLNRAGFSLITTELLSEEERRGNSLLVVATPHGSIHDIPANKTRDIPIDYEHFDEDLKIGINHLDQFVESEIASGRRIAGYGGGGRGVMTLAAMKNATRLRYVCDRNPSFHGMYTPKSNLVIVPSEQLEKDPVDTLIVFSFGYFEEIKAHVQQLNNTPAKIISMLDVLAGDY